MACASRWPCWPKKVWTTSFGATPTWRPATRAAVLEGWKLKLCAVAPKWYSDTVSAIMVPDGINGAEVIARAFKRYNLALGAGLSKVAGKLFRIGHLGDLNELMLLGAIAGAEMAMLDVGVKIEPGSGVAAAQNYWRSNSAAAVAAGGDPENGQSGMMHRVVFLDRASLKATVRKPSCAAEYIEYDKTAPDEIVPRLTGADVAIINKVPLRATTLEQLPELKMIAVAATGYDVVDVPYCKAHGIAVANIRNYAVHTVPEHAFAMILALRRNLLAYRRGCRRTASGTNRISSASSRIRSAICTARRSASSARAPSARARRPSAAPSACACCSPIIRRRRWRASPSRRTRRCSRESDVISLHCPLMPCDAQPHRSCTRFAK